jgi:hypothetical protein
MAKQSSSCGSAGRSSCGSSISSDSTDMQGMLVLCCGREQRRRLHLERCGSRSTAFTGCCGAQQQLLLCRHHHHQQQQQQQRFTGTRSSRLLPSAETQQHAVIAVLGVVWCFGGTAAAAADMQPCICSRLLAKQQSPAVGPAAAQAAVV